MYTESMKDEEILHHYYKDKKYLRARSRYFLAQKRRRLLKENHFPCVLTHRVKRANGNTYVINMWIENKRSLMTNKVGLTYAILVDSPSGYMVIKVYNRFDEDIVLRFPAHCIKRFRERMNQEGTYDQMITKFTKTSMLLQFKQVDDEEEKKVQGGSPVGAFFGENNQYGGITFKTFIPRNLLNNKQMEIHRQIESDYYDALYAMYNN